MRVDIWSDVICPWCYIGKHRFDAAAGEAGVGLQVTYRAFQLDPAAPPGTTVPVLDAYAQKFGTVERAREKIDKVTAVAAAEGLEFHLDRAKRANTVLAHRLLWWARQPGNGLDQADANDALMRAYFSEGRNIGDPDDLVEIATALGADGDAAAAFLATDEGADAVAADVRAAAEHGITAVPTFVVEDTWAILGAQEREVFVKVLRKLAATSAA